MNTQKIDCQSRIQQNHGVIPDYGIEFGPRSSQFLGAWNMGICSQQPLATDGGSQLQTLGPAKPSSTIMSRFDSPASAFYATERFMGFSQYDHQASNPLLYSQSSTSCDSKLDNFSVDSNSTPPADPNFQFRNTFQSVMRASSENPNTIQCPSIPFDGNQDIRVCRIYVFLLLVSDIFFFCSDVWFDLIWFFYRFSIRFVAICMVLHLHSRPSVLDHPLLGVFLLPLPILFPQFFTVKPESGGLQIFMSALLSV